MGLGLVHVAAVLHVRLEEHVDSLAFHLVDKPVHGTAGVEEPEINEALVILVAGITADLVGDLQKLLVAVLDAAFLFHALGVVGAHLAGPGDRHGILLDEDELCALIHNGSAGNQAAVACADHDDVGLDGLGDVSDGIGFGKVLRIIPGAALLFRCCRGVIGKSDAACGAGECGSQRAGCCAFQKVSSADFFGHLYSSCKYIFVYG